VADYPQQASGDAVVLAVAFGVVAAVNVVTDASVRTVVSVAVVAVVVAGCLGGPGGPESGNGDDRGGDHDAASTGHEIFLQLRQ
jgi:hypothetical protein